MSTGFGVSMWCWDSVVLGRFASRRVALAQALYRRLITPRGTLRDPREGTDESFFGFDVAGYVGKVGTAIAVAALPSLIRAELKKDDRVLSVDVRVSLESAGAGLVNVVIEIDVEPADETEAFTLTVAVEGDILVARGVL